MHEAHDAGSAGHVALHVLHALSGLDGDTSRYRSTRPCRRTRQAWFLLRRFRAVPAHDDDACSPCREPWPTPSSARMPIFSSFFSSSTSTSTPSFSSASARRANSAGNRTFGGSLTRLRAISHAFPAASGPAFPRAARAGGIGRSDDVTSIVPAGLSLPASWTCIYRSYMSATRGRARCLRPPRRRLRHSGRPILRMIAIGLARPARPDDGAAQIEVVRLGCGPSRFPGR